ncbi:MAG: DsbA family protein, partial [Bradymonadaceae bacterium]
LGPQNGVPALEVFDPLCPACRGFENHLEETVYGDKLARKAVLFPLDDECNWMIDNAVHPGACAVSEAVLCAEDNPDKVVDWAFQHQKTIRSWAASEEGAARRMVKQQFPELSSCVGSPKVQARLNQSLRWAVDNELRVLTPQLYVDGVRLCDEDVDLGLEYALSEMLKRRRNGTLKQAVKSDEEGDQ